MKKTLISIMLLAWLLPVAMQVQARQKTIDNGGSGAYKAEAREEKTFKDAVIYKPVDMKAAAKDGLLPVLLRRLGRILHGLLRLDSKIL